MTDCHTVKCLKRDGDLSVQYFEIQDGKLLGVATYSITLSIELRILQSLIRIA